MTLTEEMILQYMRSQQGLAMYTNALFHFADEHGVDAETFRFVWDELCKQRKIGRLTFNGGLHLPFGEIVYTLPRQPHAGWACEWCGQPKPPRRRTR